MKVFNILAIVFLGCAVDVRAESEHYKAARNLENERKYEEAFNEWSKSAEAGDYTDYNGDSNPSVRAFECAQKMGRFKEGIAYLEGVLEKKPRGYLQHTLGDFYENNLKEFEKARSHYHAAYELFQAEGNESWATWSLYREADAYMDELNDADYYDNRRLRHAYWAKVDVLLKEALTLSEKIEHPVSRRKQRHDILDHLADLYEEEAYTKADPEIARQYREQSDALLRNSERRDWNNVRKALDEHEEKKEYAEAKVLLENYLADNPAATNNINTFWWMRKVYQQAGDLEGAYQACLSAFDLIDLKRSRKRTDVEKIAAQQRPWLAYYQYGIELACKLNRHDEALQHIERSKARAMLDLIGERNAMTTTTTISQQEKERKLLLAKADEIRAALSREADMGSASNAASLQRSLVLVEDNSEKLKAQIDEKRRELMSTGNVQPLKFDEVRQLIGDATLIMYWYDVEVGVLNKDEVHANYLKGSSYFPKLVEELYAGLDQQAKTARSLEIETTGAPAPAAGTNFMHAAQELYRICIRPLEKYIHSNMLIISADRSLANVPFEVFHDGEKFLAEKYTVVYIPSMSVMKYCMDRRKPLGRKILALGNPNLRDPKYRLAYAEEEVKSLAGIFPDARVLVGDDASEKAVKLLGGDADILHFACHGTLDNDDPDLTSLRLSPDNDNDGFLHVQEIFDLNVNAGLVTLSACESGRGEVTQAGEILGMTRAWMYAGAPSVLASSWKVDDRGTAKLMSEFYRNLSTMNKAEALRAAQMSMIKEGYSPFYWGAFCLYGDYM